MIFETYQQNFGNLDYLIKSYELSKFRLIFFLYAALSSGTLLQSVMSKYYNCLIHTIHEIFTFLMKMYSPFILYLLC